MRKARIVALTTLTMIGFASNSLLCRFALTDTTIDPASFTAVRIVSGALSLWLMVFARGGLRAERRGNWCSALALFAYAALFSFAYVSLSAATGALLLFGAVQVTMISHGFWSGERLQTSQFTGLVLALGGLTALLLPGLSAPPLGGSLKMIGAGMAWGIYSLRGRAAGDAALVTADNFLRAVPLAFLLQIIFWQQAQTDSAGLWCAAVSGAFASAIVYVIWYRVLPDLRATSAGVVQLSVPVIAALGGILLLGEPLTLRFLVTSGAILGGIFLAVRPGYPQEPKLPSSNATLDG